MSMREMMARAMWKSFQDTQDNHLRKDDWDSNAGLMLREHYFHAVNAVLDVLIEPTEEMHQAARDCSATAIIGDPRIPWQPTLIDQFQAMIRAAKEGK